MAARSRTFAVWGGGGHGKVVADLVRASGGRVRGFIDRAVEKLDEQVEPGGGRVVFLEAGFLAALRTEGGYPSGIDAVALAVGDNRLRMQCLERLGDREAPALVHPSAVVSPSARLGRGTVVFSGAVINAAAVLGRAVIVNSAAVVEHDCIVADGAHVSPGAVLAGQVVAGERSWVGAGATVIQGVRIGAGAIVGAGAVVLQDVPDGVTVAGVPARPIQRGRA